MKTLSALLGGATLVVAGLAWAEEAVDSPTGYQSETSGAAYVSEPVVTTPGTDDAGVQMASIDTKAKADAEACAKAQQKANETGEERLQHVADQKCRVVDYMSLNPAAGPVEKETEVSASQAAPATALGADRRDQANYYPPENYKINGKEASGALTESFNQQMKAAGYDDKAIAAVGGNLQHESGMFYGNKWKWDPQTGTHQLLTTNGAMSRGDKQNGIYTSFGLAQYHDTSTGVGRATKMLNFVGGDSLSPNGLQGTRNKQIEYLIQEMPKQLGANAYGKLMNPNVSAYEKTGIVVERYEIPKAVATEVYGRMGGADRWKSAQTIGVAMNAPVVLDTDSSNNTSRGGRPVSNPGGIDGSYTSSIGNGAGAMFGYGAGGGLGMNLAQLGFGGTGGSVGSGQNLLGMVIAQAIGQMMVKNQTHDAKTLAEVEPAAGPAKGYDVLKAMSDLCGDELGATAEAEMLKVKLCQAKVES